MDFFKIDNLYHLFTLILSVTSTVSEYSTKCGYGLTGQLFMFDDHSPCVYHWCAKGKYLGKAQCAPGSAVPYGYVGTNNPCIIKTEYCGLNRGHLFYKSDAKFSYTENGHPFVNTRYSYSRGNKPEYKDGDSYSQVNSYFRSSGYSTDEQYTNDQASPKVKSQSFAYSKTATSDDRIADDYPAYPYRDPHGQSAHAYTQHYDHRGPIPPYYHHSNSVPEHIIQRVVEKLLSKKKDMKRDDHYHDRHKNDDDGSYEKRRYRPKKKKSVKACGLNPQLFLSDSQDRCKYYWCAGGAIAGPFNCAPGTGVPFGHTSKANPCTIPVDRCQSNNYNSGGAIYKSPSVSITWDAGHNPPSGLNRNYVDQQYNHNSKVQSRSVNSMPSVTYFKNDATKFYEFLQSKKGHYPLVLNQLFYKGPPPSNNGQKQHYQAKQEPMNHHNLAPSPFRHQTSQNTKRNNFLPKAFAQVQTSVNVQKPKAPDIGTIIGIYKAGNDLFVKSKGRNKVKRKVKNTGKDDGKEKSDVVKDEKPFQKKEIAKDTTNKAKEKKEEVIKEKPLNDQPPRTLSDGYRTKTNLDIIHPGFNSYKHDAHAHHHGPINIGQPPPGNVWAGRVDLVNTGKFALLTTPNPNTLAKVVLVDAKQDPYGLKGPTKYDFSYVKTKTKEKKHGYDEDSYEHEHEYKPKKKKKHGYHDHDDHDHHKYKPSYKKQKGRGSRFVSTMALLASMIAFSCVLEYVSGVPISACLSGSNIFLADSEDRCIYYRCIDGVMTGPAWCKPGTGVPLKFRDNKNPCSVKSVECSKTKTKSRYLEKYNREIPLGPHSPASFYDWTHTKYSMAIETSMPRGLEYGHHPMYSNVKQTDFENQKNSHIRPYPKYRPNGSKTAVKIPKDEKQTKIKNRQDESLRKVSTKQANDKAKSRKKAQINKNYNKDGTKKEAVRVINIAKVMKRLAKALKYRLSNKNYNKYVKYQNFASRNSTRPRTRIQKEKLTKDVHAHKKKVSLSTTVDKKQSSKKKKADKQDHQTNEKKNVNEDINSTSRKQNDASTLNSNTAKDEDQVDREKKGEKQRGSPKFDMKEFVMRRLKKHFPDIQINDEGIEGLGEEFVEPGPRSNVKLNDGYGDKVEYSLQKKHSGYDVEYEVKDRSNNYKSDPLVQALHGHDTGGVAGAHLGNPIYGGQVNRVQLGQFALLTTPDPRKLAKVVYVDSPDKKQGDYDFTFVKKITKKKGYHDDHSEEEYDDHDDHHDHGYKKKRSYHKHDHGYKHEKKQKEVHHVKYIPKIVKILLPTTTTPPPGVEAAETEQLFPLVNSGFHISGGIEMCRGCNITACHQHCRNTPSCMGVDWNYMQRACFAHTHDTVCNVMTAKDSVTNYKRVVCVAPANPTPVAPRVPPPPNVVQRQVVQQQPQMQQSQMMQQPQMQQSQMMPQSQMLQAANTVVMQPSQMKPLMPAGYRAPTAGFKSQKNAGPTILPPGWSAYPGCQVSGGKFITDGLNGDTCFAICKRQPSCLGVDFNSIDGSCWMHDSKTSCNEKKIAEHVYHAKKVICPPPYPRPVGMAPLKNEYP